MSVEDVSSAGDQRLVRYLLGMLPDEEAERLDEASIVDDEVANHLRCIENDLVDAYVAGTLDRGTQERFESFYLASPRRREKVNFARRFARAMRDAPEPVPVDAPGDLPQPTTVQGRRGRRIRGLASAAGLAAVLLLATAVLFVRDGRLRRNVAFPQHAATTSDQAARGAGGHTAPERRSADAVTALVLLPETRSLGTVDTIAIAPGVRHVSLELRLESDDYTRYHAVVKAASDNRVVWRSDAVPPLSRGGAAFVPVVLPTDVLESQHYSIELDGVDRAGRVEAAGSYAFLVSR